MVRAMLRWQTPGFMHRKIEVFYYFMKISVLYHFKLFSMACDPWPLHWNFASADDSGTHDMQGILFKASLTHFLCLVAMLLQSKHTHWTEIMNALLVTWNFILIILWCSPVLSTAMWPHSTHSALTRPFKILTPSSLRSLSATFPHQHHTYHNNHGRIMPGLSWNHLGTFWAVTEHHRKHHRYI